ncbi:SOS response-associated peptidase [Candidatus Poriferisocius sp.]|uniref:SOS response-associated peptidase n=1 Tax=Candidatus Poriferisocius sp. TaxID=3101276 RepID=UPI003B02121C
MCGRYSLTASPAELATRFEFEGYGEAAQQRFNIAPTQQVLTVVGGEIRQTGLMRWGLIPPWAKDTSIGSAMINARAETVAEKPSFRDALKHRRCLVPADGFYEWQKTGGAKRPMRVVLRTGEPFAFAGIWSAWRDPAGSRIESCAIITTEANNLLKPIHHRMPVILPEELEALWLDAPYDDCFPLAELLAPYPSDAMKAYEVSTSVNSASNDIPEVAEPVGNEADSVSEPRLPLG